MNDLFGQPINETEERAKAKRPKKTGHASAIPGPAGKTCHDCEHIRRSTIRSGRSFTKCNLMRHAWTHGPGSDIRHKDAACSRFSPDLQP